MPGKGILDLRDFSCVFSASVYLEGANVGTQSLRDDNLMATNAWDTNAWDTNALVLITVLASSLHIPGG